LFLFSLARDSKSARPSSCNFSINHTRDTTFNDRLSLTEASAHLALCTLLNGPRTAPPQHACVYCIGEKSLLPAFGTECENTVSHVGCLSTQNEDLNNYVHSKSQDTEHGRPGSIDKLSATSSLYNVTNWPIQGLCLRHAQLQLQVA